MQYAAQKRLVQDLLDHAGVRIDGDRPFDIRIHEDEFYPRVLAGGSLALGNCYMDGWWDCEALDQFFERIMGARLDEKVRQSRALIWAAIKTRLTNSQGYARAFDIGERHYDTGNDLFSIMLDKRLTYSCAYWRSAATLDQAQEAKLELTCRKLNLRPGMRVLDIGCGWGGLAIYAAEKYGARVTGITVSRAQLELARRHVDGLPVTFELQDYRDLKDTFDRIVSIGMFEHVGVSNYKTFMQVVHRCLKDNGLFLLHTIGGNTSVRSL
ncbi:MAG: cyclopropane fatty acyl phospholipid synthase, partial [Desulfobacterales bacterium]